MTITIEEIRALPVEITGQQDTQIIADALSVGRIKVIPTEIGKGRVLGTLGFAAGNALLDTIDNVEDFRHVRQLVANGWLDVGEPLTRSMIDQVCTPEDAVKLKALAEVPDPVDEFEVRCLCWSDIGEWRV